MIALIAVSLGLRISKGRDLIACFGTELTDDQLCQLAGKFLTEFLNCIVGLDEAATLTFPPKRQEVIVLSSINAVRYNGRVREIDHCRPSSLNVFFDLLDRATG